MSFPKLFLDLDGKHHEERSRCEGEFVRRFDRNFRKELTR